MFIRNFIRRIVCVLLILSSACSLNAHRVTFCGEVIPMDNDFVANKLMDVIRKQMPTVNLPALRARALQYMPMVDQYLTKNGVPYDFRYLPIVESGFANLTSRVAAYGYWQIMPATAKDLGLNIAPGNDDRANFHKSTDAACRLIKSYYMQIVKQRSVSSWVLTAAAYNWGIGNIMKAIKSQGKDYFNMDLNKETAIYVYKIIAIKELFEYPELYIKNFGYNVFSATASKNQTYKGKGDDDVAFTTISVKEKSKIKPKPKPEPTYVGAHIRGKHKNFKDGDLVSVELEEDLKVKGGFTKKGSVIKGTGWIIDGRVFVDMGYGHDVLLCDQNSQRGIALDSLKKDEPILLQNDIADDESQW